MFTANNGSVLIWSDKSILMRGGEGATGFNAVQHYTGDGQRLRSEETDGRNDRGVPRGNQGSF